MSDNNQLFNNININCIDGFINSRLKSKMVLNGFLPPFDLFLINSILKSNKKIIHTMLQKEQLLGFEVAI